MSTKKHLSLHPDAIEALNNLKSGAILTESQIVSLAILRLEVQHQQSKTPIIPQKRNGITHEIVTQR